jgi:hypothetical protein
MLVALSTQARAQPDDAHTGGPKTLRVGPIPECRTKRQRRISTARRLISRSLTVKVDLFVAADDAGWPPRW